MAQMNIRKDRHYCIVQGCMNQKCNKSLSFFKLPYEKERRDQWLRTIKRTDLISLPFIKPESYVVCCVHFEASTMRCIRKLLPDAMPTKFVPIPTVFERASADKQIVMLKINPVMNNLKKSPLIEYDSTEQDDDDSSDQPTMITENNNSVSIGTQTDTVFSIATKPLLSKSCGTQTDLFSETEAEKSQIKIQSTFSLTSNVKNVSLLKTETPETDIDEKTANKTDSLISAVKIENDDSIPLSSIKTENHDPLAPEKDEDDPTLYETETIASVLSVKTEVPFILESCTKTNENVISTETTKHVSGFESEDDSEDEEILSTIRTRQRSAKRRIPSEELANKNKKIKRK